MKVFNTILILIFSIVIGGSQTQSIQSFNYNSETRDTIISFPEGDHTRFEKIIMHYSMRCKDGLVSTGSERNKGCGEWDYSCNTYIVDSTRVDSVKATTPEFDMPGFTESSFNYSNDSTYTFYQSVHKKVVYDQVLREDDYLFSQSLSELDQEIWNDDTGINMYYVITPDWFETNDVDRLNGIRWPAVGDIQFKNLLIRILQSESASIDEALQSESAEWQNVHHNNTLLNSDNDVIAFYDDFRWDKSSFVIVNISYDKVTGWSPSVQGEEFDQSQVAISALKDAKYINLSPSGNIWIDEGLPEISDEITISFWHKGSANLPLNSSILEGVDGSQNRNTNIHLPWGNGQIYWDCGNEGGNYDRINKTAQPEEYKGQWNHWAFTKNSNTGNMSIYLNGKLWHSGTGMFRKINIENLKLGSNFAESLFHHGSLDEFRIWNIAFDATQVQNEMYNSIDDNHPLFSNLICYYNFNQSDFSSINDQSVYNHNGILKGQLQTPSWNARDNFIDRITSTIIPAHNLVEGVYFKTVTDSLVLDSILSQPQRVNHYVINGTDRELEWTIYYYQAGDYPIYDEMNNIIDYVNYPSSGTFERGELLYYIKSPMAYEIMSFVTPYGIGLDFGFEGLTWTFDLTDFAPILKGQKRMFMSRGGQWQEEMDIRFEFIEGIPDRDVIDIQQIWRVDQIAFGNIQNDWRFEPRKFTYDPSVSSYVIKTAITGHGQEGEFIPRQHVIDVDGFTDSWTVWKECAENPVYPQGGTWVYDRAGWCPGMSTDIREYDVTPYFQFANTPTVDYNVVTASGDSRYIVSSQLVSYGPPNKSHDASIFDLIYPSNKIEHGKYNPNCQAPEIIIRNHGSENLRSAIIRYGIAGKNEFSYNWQGNLPFLVQQRITLPFQSALSLAEDSDVFFVEIEMDQANDQNERNNRVETVIKRTPHIENEIVIVWRTNSTPQETSYTVYDENGNSILFKSGTTLNRNTTYRDTLSSLNGCFSLVVNDTDNDGVSWWANNDGDGYIQLHEVGGPMHFSATDFGAFEQFNFTAGMISNIDDIYQVNNVFLYPNPGSQDIYLSDLSDWDGMIRILVYDELGRTILMDERDNSTLSKRAIKELDTIHEGVYYIQLSDSKRRALLKFAKL